LRRLAAQSREDTYSSLKDYQTVHDARGRRFTVTGAADEAKLVLRQELAVKANTDFVGFGGFLRPSQDTTVRIQLSVGDTTEETSKPLLGDWTRVGVVVEAAGAAEAQVTLVWPASVDLDIWGLACDRIDLPGPALETSPTTTVLAQGHLAPETFYLPHEGPLALDVDEAASDEISFSDGALISLKKCSYCGRHLPLDMERLGALSFHKHNAKRSKHQNECRSCKAWRINNHFNPIRTVDQLHESSSITRERKLLLREPQILQAIKERTGRGLKSQIWEQFDRRCFVCDRELELDDVQLDHTRPLAYLWPIDEHATCLCAEHNNAKKEKFPVEFYNEEQLRRLSEISKLPYEELTTKKLNEVELQRILDDLPAFALDWEPRTFAATARKIAELRPDVDLYDRLRLAEPATYVDLLERLAERPPAVDEDE
jgi:hypothetical protein